VVKIGVRSTVIETEEGQTVFLPNSIFISNPLVRIEKAAKQEGETSTEKGLKG